MVVPAANQEAHTHSLCFNARRRVEWPCLQPVKERVLASSRHKLGRKSARGLSFLFAYEAGSEQCAVRKSRPSISLHRRVSISALQRAEELEAAHVGSALDLDTLLAAPLDHLIRSQES